MNETKCRASTRVRQPTALQQRHGGHRANARRQSDRGGVDTLRRTAADLCFQAAYEEVEGIYEYGSLADDVGRQFEEKWLRNYDEFRSGALEAPDFSATTDLYQIVSNVHDMKLFPFELRAVVSLIAAALLPFIPVVLLMMPFKSIVTELARLLV